MTALINYIKFGFVFLIFLQADKCDEVKPQDSEPTEVGKSQTITNSPLQKVHLKRYGGMMGHEENLIVTQDSTFYSYKNREMMKPKVIKDVTPEDKWVAAVQSFDVNELANVKDGEMKVAFDGIDNVFTLEGDFQKQEFRNPTENPTALNPFFELFNEARSDLFDEIRKN